MQTAVADWHSRERRAAPMSRHCHPEPPDRAAISGCGPAGEPPCFGGEAGRSGGAASQSPPSDVSGVFHHDACKGPDGHYRSAGWGVWHEGWQPEPSASGRDGDPDPSAGGGSSGPEPSAGRGSRGGWNDDEWTQWAKNRPYQARQDQWSVADTGGWFKQYGPWYTAGGGEEQGPQCLDAEDAAPGSGSGRSWLELSQVSEPPQPPQVSQLPQPWQPPQPPQSPKHREDADSIASTVSEWVNPINGVAAVAAECAPGGGAVGVRSEGPTDFVQAMELFTADYWAGHEQRVTQDAAAAGASQGRRVLTVDYFKDIAFQQTSRENNEALKYLRHACRMKRDRGGSDYEQLSEEMWVRPVIHGEKTAFSFNEDEWKKWRWHEMIAGLPEDWMEKVVTGEEGRSGGLVACMACPRPNSYSHSEHHAWEKEKQPQRPKERDYDFVLIRYDGSGIRLHPHWTKNVVDVYPIEGHPEEVNPPRKGVGKSDGPGTFKRYAEAGRRAKIKAKVPRATAGEHVPSPPPFPPSPPPPPAQTLPAVTAVRPPQPQRPPPKAA